MQKGDPGKNSLGNAAERYAIALCSVIAGVALRFALAGVLGFTAPYITLFPAVMFAAWFGGLGPGIVATILGLLAAFYFFIPPIHDMRPATAADAASGLVFVGVSAFIAVFTELLRRSRARSEQRFQALAIETALRGPVEEELAESRRDAERARDLLHTILSGISDAVIATDANGTVTFLNALARELTGWSHADAVGKAVPEVFLIRNEATGLPVEIPAGNAIREGAAVSRTEPAVLLGRDGREIPIEESTAPIRDEQGRVLGMVLVFRDVTDRRRSEDALKRSEERLKLALDAGQIGVWDWDVVENRVEWSELVYDIHGVERGKFGGKVDDFAQLVHPDDRGRVNESIQASLQHGSTYEAEFRVVHPDGITHWVATTGVVVRNRKGEPVRMLGATTDVTARKQAEAHLRQQWHTFDTALSHTPDCTYTFDLDGRFTYLNRALLSSLQRPLQDALGKNFIELDYPPEIAARLQRQIQQVIDTRLPLRDNTPLAGPNGEIRYYEYVFVPVLAANGQVEAVSGASHDVTERKLAEEQERERQARLRESARLESLGVMAGGIAHDFNNLLVGILGNASLLAETALEGDRPIAADITLAAERAADLTNQMLAFSGRGRFVLETLDLNKLMLENLTLLRASIPRNVGVDLDFAPEACFIEADRAQIQQVIMNLLINASEAIGGAPGVLAIRTARTERLAARLSEHLYAVVLPGKYVMMEIRDSGNGMTPETLKRMFDPFFTTKFSGRGLGLAAVQGIVKGHKGDIEVESQSGAGSTFRILLPESERADASSRPPDSIFAGGFPDRTILVVDDEEIVRRMASAALQARGFRVILAGNGEEALSILGAHSGAALVILDLTMPVMTGEQAVPLIKELHPNLPIILSSGFSEAEIFPRFASAGLAGFLQKPYDANAIVSKVAQALQSFAQ